MIAGATATGKTGLAIEVATRLAGKGIAAEVISADSRQVYRGLDIGTAKATLAERRGIPHHGLDLVEPDEPFTVADFAAHARAALAGIHERRGLAILAGGTGLYLRAVARGLRTDELPADPDVRARLEAEFLAVGLEPLVERLQAVAPQRAAAIDTANPRRVVRALEMATVAGGDPAIPVPRGYDGRVTWIGLGVEPAIHREWIANRARAQFDAGLVDEAQALRGRYDPALPAFSAIGYREAWAVLDGELTLEAAIAEDARRNQAFAKRQRTWFRSEPDVEWLDPTDSTALERAVAVAQTLTANTHGERDKMAPMPSETRHLTVFIDRSPSEVYDYGCDPRHIPEWAPGLGRGIEEVDGRWYVVTDAGRLPVVFAERNSLGVLDHDVTLPSGEVVHNPMRVVPHDNGSEVMFTLRRRPEMTDDDFAHDAGLVQADLDRLKRILESGLAG